MIQTKKSPERMLHCRLSEWVMSCVAALAMVCHADAADLTQRLQFDIAPQSLSTALVRFSEQAKLQFNAAGSLNEIRSGGVHGEHTAAAALDLLLRDTGLEYRVVDEGTVAIRMKDGAAGIGMVDEETVRIGQLANAEISSSYEGKGGGEDQKGSNGASASSEAEKSKVQEIVVTAQKRKESLQDVPISISVLSGRQLDSSTSQGLTDVLRSLPGVSTLVASQSGGSQVAVRGVTGTPSIGTGSSPVGYYIDGVPFGMIRTSFVPDVNIYDLERVEVLRGPQGTLYGASALNGVVRVLSHEANLEEFELKTRGLLSSTARGGENGQADLVVNMPVVEGKLAARATASYQDLSGWIDRPTGDDRNTAESTNVRLKINAQPTEQLSVGWSAWRSRADYGAPSYSPDNRQANVVIEESIASDFDNFGLTIGYNFSGFSLTSVTSYIDYNSRNFLANGPFNQEILVEAATMSQEITLNSTAEGPWRWSLGGFYRDEEDRAFSDIPTLLTSPTDSTYHSASHALFGEVTRSFFNGKLELTGGLRYFEDRQTARQDAAASVALPVNPPAGLYDRPEFDAVTPRVVLTWHPGKEDLTIYGSYAEGFRSGYPQTADIVALFPPIKPDSLHNYEIGMKGGLWRGRVNFDSALYYLDWTDVQQTIGVPLGVPPPGASVIYQDAGVNSASASGIGFEFAGTARLTDQLTLGVGYGWNDLTFDTDVFSFGAPLFSKGSRLNYSPKKTSSVSLNYDFPLGGSGLRGGFAASANSVSPLQSRRIVGNGVATDSGDSMLISRFSFAIGSPAGWTATLFADNLNDEEGTFLNEDEGNGGHDMRVRPRTVGVQFEYSFRR